ncbi:hypothetical protein FE257_013094 [Aspergillus nanangensis]|uniref:Uncharacterized protein n=1 Tax=Aspergillus nanangensis TaxID=2582783 RepID=A0AAD4CFG3_ASPNN|nr:hypothetical protein FE257_013094 [Aspergillus nanangensis]
MPGSPSTLHQGAPSAQPRQPTDLRIESPSETMSPNTRGDGKSTPKKSAKRKKNRQRKRRNRRPSFLSTDDPNGRPSIPEEPEDLMAAEQTAAPSTLPFYKLNRGLSTTSLESEALLDHRNQPMTMPRRESRLAQSFRPGSLSTTTHMGARNPPSATRPTFHEDESDGFENVNDRTPLVRPTSSHKLNFQPYGTDAKTSPFSLRRRPSSAHSGSSRCSPRRVPSSLLPNQDRNHDINNPPSIPGTPKLGPEMGYDDAVVTGADFDFSMAQSLDERLSSIPHSHDMVIDVEGGGQRYAHSDPASQHSPTHELRRRRTMPAEEDVCFPTEEASVLAEDEGSQRVQPYGRRRRRRRQWPDLSVLEEWSREEKEGRTGGLRTKKISEPMLVEGRLRPQYKLWRREEDEAPFRFTYFNEEFQSTIHAQTVSELVQPGASFRELFIPDPPELEASSSSEEDEQDSDDRLADSMMDVKSNATPSNFAGDLHKTMSNEPHPEATGDCKQQPRMSIISEAMSEARTSTDISPHPGPPPKVKQYGPRPTFWLDVLSPTDAEMRAIAKAFGIHALTAEDIMMQEAREKVELFRNYYFVNYRTFEQDPNSENYLQPVNMYVVVFREGVLSFHFSQTPHPANVRRRIRQLMDYLILSSDWISYALIDDITDVFGPLIQAIEDEVDEIDEMITGLHSPNESSSNEKEYRDDVSSSSLSPGEMLRRVGVCRKKVMGMYRLLSNKADVVKGFAKRCNEQWEVAPKSEIGLYLGDIQDHIMTMTSSLTYYETLLSRAHSNYLAQINILMNERQEQTADVLGKLTVMGTIVLPLNIICGMWGMNVKVPGQEVDSLNWFWSITGGLVLFAFASFLIAKRSSQGRSDSTGIMAAESERSPYTNGTSGGPKVAQEEEAALSASRRSPNQGDMMELPRSSVNSQAQAIITSQLPKLSPSVPGASAPASATNSAISSRESSPARSTRRPHNSSRSRLSPQPRKRSSDRSPSRLTNNQNSGSGTQLSVTAAPLPPSQISNPPVLSPPPPNAEPSTDVLDPEKPNMPLWPTSRRPEPEPNLANTSSKRASPQPEENTKADRSAPRAVNRNNGSVSALETVQEMVSDQSTPSTDTVLHQPLTEEPQLNIIDEDPNVKTPKQPADSGSDSGGNKSSGQTEDGRRRSSMNGKDDDALIPKRSTTSLSGGRNKPTDGSVRNMIVETETVSSIPQVSLGVATGDRNNSGRADSGTLRMKPSTETIRPKKEKRRVRKPAALTSGGASSKADIFEAKVASAVDEADVSDSDETFVYESNPPDPYPVRQHRYHSRTPSATSMASQVDQLAGRGRPGIRDGNHSVAGKRSMKFTNNTYTGSVDGDVGEESARSQSRVDGSGTHTPRHYHIGRYGRNNMYPSLFDGDSPFPQPQTHLKSPRHYIGSGIRQARHPSSRTAPNYRSINSAKKAGEILAYDFDAEGADDERTPLVGSPRVPRSRHGNRRPNSASLRQMEYMQQRQRGCFSRYGACVVVAILFLLVVGGATSFIVAITKTLVDVKILEIQNVLASEQEIMLDLSVQAINPNLFPVAIDDMDMNIFAKSRYVGTDKFWRDQDSDWSDFPRVEGSRKRAELARQVRCRNDSDCDVKSTRSSDGGVDHGTDPMDPDPTGDPQTMLLGRVFHFDSPLTFDPSPWTYDPTTSKGQIRLTRPGNKTEEGGTERWERVMQHPFDLIVRGVVKYQLPLSSRFQSASVSSSVKVIPNDDDNSNPNPGNNDTIGITITNLRQRSLPRSSEPSTMKSVREAFGMIARQFIA